MTARGALANVMIAGHRLGTAGADDVIRILKKEGYHLISEPVFSQTTVPLEAPVVKFLVMGTCDEKILDATIHVHQAELEYASDREQLQKTIEATLTKEYLMGLAKHLHMVPEDNKKEEQ